MLFLPTNKVSGISSVSKEVRARRRSGSANTGTKHAPHVAAEISDIFCFVLLGTGVSIISQDLLPHKSQERSHSPSHFQFGAINGLKMNATFLCSLSSLSRTPYLAG